MYIGGFDRRGCAASLNNATQTSCKVSGISSDIADFVTFYIFNSDDNYGHLYTSKYLPKFDLTGVVLDFDLAIVNCYYPGSTKFPSVPWGSLQWVKADGTSGSTALVLSSPLGGVAASIVLTVGGTPGAFDRVQVIFLGNTVFDYILDGSDTISSVINSTTANTNGYVGLVKQINNANAGDPIANPFTATGTATQITITSTSATIDGNSIQFFTQYKLAGTTTISPANAKMIGGVDPTSVHVTVDFTFLGIDQLRQAWLTIAPVQPYDSSGAAQTGKAFSQLNFSYSLSNMAITDPGSLTDLQVAGSGSVVVDSRDIWSSFVGSWAAEEGFYHYGFSKASSVVGDKITVSYSNQFTHDLYLGTALYVDRGILGIKVDGIVQTDLDCYLNVASQLVTRRKISAAVAAGDHIVEFTIKTKSGSSSGNTCYFDYLQAAVESDPESPGTTYASISAALDFDTDQTYKISPARNLFNLTQTGLLGDIDLYAGVFFALIRRRRGGSFHNAVLTISGTLNSGTGFGDGDTFFITIGSTSFGVAVYPADTLNSVAQRFVNAINALFVGVRASRTGTGELTIVVQTPINGFFLDITSTTFSGATFIKTGDIGVFDNESVYAGGNEGIWEVDDTQTSPLNQGFIDYLSDFDSVFTGAGFTITLAFSQELLAPPDVDTIAGAWIQRFLDDSTVLTSTDFGSWGQGLVESVAGSGTVTVKVTGHGLISGYTISKNGNGAFTITVIDVDHFSFVGSATVGDVVRAQLQTSQVNFNPSTVTPYLGNCYYQVASILSSPYLQFGEVGWWFFPGLIPTDTRGMAFYDAYTSDAANTSLGRPLYHFTDPDNDPAVNAHADANFLQSQIEDHIHTICLQVLGGFPGAKFSMLFPSDVNWPTSFQDMVAVPLGGQLNYYINIPGDYKNPGSDIDRIDGEALAWGTTYRTVDNAIVSMSLAASAGWTWDLANCKYFVPWQNGGCPWEAEFLQTARTALGALVFWAFDHLILFSWKLPFPNQLTGNE